jgi:hypothetical protein
MHYEIIQDDVKIAAELVGCDTIDDLKKRLEALFPGEAWWVYKGGSHVRLHRFARVGLWGRIFGQGKPKPVFFAVEIN